MRQCANRPTIYPFRKKIDVTRLTCEGIGLLGEPEDVG
jgi:hypothetical protein